MNLTIPSSCLPHPVCPGPCSLPLELLGGDVLVRRGGGCPGVRGRRALQCSFQRRKNPWYPAVFTASTHVLLVSTKATIGAYFGLSPKAVCRFCMKPDGRLTDKPLQRCVQTPFVPFRLHSTSLRSELLLTFSAGAFEWLLMGRINPPTGCKQRFTLSLSRTWTVQCDLGAGELPFAFQRGHPG